MMKGEFNYTLKKLIELSLAVGKAPVIVCKPLDKIIPVESNEVSSSETPPIKLAETLENYSFKGK
jgi:hypothetical protein